MQDVMQSSPRRDVLLAAAVFLITIIPVLSTPVLPTIDFYNHVARYFLLSAADRPAFLMRNYQANWSLLPNIGMDVVGAAAMSILPPRLTPHVLTILSMLVQFTGVLFFSRRLLGRFSLLTAVLLAPLMYSYIFVWGFANFLLGLGLAFWAAGWWLVWRERLAVATPVACLFAIAIFLCHGVAFALYGVLVASLELGFFLTSPERRLGAAARQFAALLVQAVAPVALFLSTTTAKAPGGVTNADESVHRLVRTGQIGRRLVELALYRAQTIVRVAEGPSLWFDALTFALTLGALAFLMATGRARLPRVIWPAAAAGVILTLLVPPALFGVGYVADRMPLFLAFVVVGSIDVRIGRDALSRTAAGLIVFLTVARLAYIGLDWRQYRAAFAEFRQIARLIPPGSLVDQVNVSRVIHVSRSRCEMFGPLLVFDGQATPLFANATQQPLRIVGPLRQAEQGLPTTFGVTDAQAPAFFGSYVAQVAKSKRFDYMLICRAERLAQMPPPGARVVARTPRFTLLSLHPA